MRTCLALLLGFTLAGCQAADAPARDRPAARAANDVTLYRYAGSRQCSGGGITPQDARRILAAAGVDVREAGCGADGRMYPSVCGSGDGRIVVVKVPASQAREARSHGFAPLEELPDAARVRCP